MHLHAFADRKVGGLSRLGLGGRNEHLTARIAIIEHVLCLEHNRTRAFHLSIEMRGAVLKRLKLTNDFPKLLALFEVIERHVHCAGTDANQLCGSAKSPGIEQCCKGRPTGINLANDGIGIDLHAI